MKDRLQSRLQALLEGLQPGPDGIWSSDVFSTDQESERNLRERVAAEHHGDDYLGDIARHHSIPVMDHEVMRFLDAMPRNAIILDVGGCWGWHWRNIPRQRPDICIVIVDFVRANLLHARKLLGTLVGDRIALVHANATMLPFPDNAFEGFWTVQTFQHIPDFRRACQEAFRVLKTAGRLENYSLHITPLVELTYRFFRRPYHKQGMIEGLFYLSRANDGHQAILSEIFNAPVTNRYTEILFHPDLKLTFSGRENSWIGRLDASLGSVSSLGRLAARQRSFGVVKS